MSLFRFQWVRRLIRQNTKPIPENKAFDWKEKLSVIYMLVAWNAFGAVCYAFYKGKGDWAKYYSLKSEEELKMSPAKRWTVTLGIQDATVYSVKGIGNVEKYEVHNNPEELQKTE